MKKNVAKIYVKATPISEIMAEGKDYKGINAYQKVIETIKTKIKEGKPITFYRSYVSVEGETFNIEPELVKSLMAGVGS